jgi:hypothetical protein
MVPNWLPELGTLGYADPLPPPTSAIQATLILHQKEMEFHKFVQAMDVEATNSVGERTVRLPPLQNFLKHLPYETGCTYWRCRIQNVRKVSVD